MLYEFVFALRHVNQRTIALWSGVRCWPIRVCALSTANDRVRAVELKPVVATERGRTAVTVAVRFCDRAIVWCVGVRASALRAGAAAAGCSAAPADRSFESGVART